MTITYEFEVTALCPNEPHVRNYYQATLESQTLIWTEKIEEVADGYAGLAVGISQEELTEALAAAFPGATVTLVGQHGRVRITSHNGGGRRTGPRP